LAAATAVARSANAPISAALVASDRPRLARQAFSTSANVTVGWRAPWACSSGWVPSRASPHRGAAVSAGGVHGGAAPALPNARTVRAASPPTMIATSLRPAAISSQRWFSSDWGVLPPQVLRRLRAGWIPSRSARSRAVSR
jgi:hypothetical protein